MKIILFDFFGVLSTPVYMQVISKYVPLHEREKWVQLLDKLDDGSVSEDEYVSRISEATSVDTKSIWKVINAAPQIDEDLIAYIVDELKLRTDIGLLTNIPRSLLERIMGDRLNIFDYLFVSSDLGLVKPDRKIFERVINDLNVGADNIIFVDDSETNVLAAQQLGIKVIHYTSLPALKTDLRSHSI